MYLPDTVFSIFFIFATGVDNLLFGVIVNLEAFLGGFTDEDGCLDPFPPPSFLVGSLDPFPPQSVLGGCLDPFPSPSLFTH